ncbi:DinB family protein [Lentibacillus sediminis]|uniref:DinB family protein n=1 Tax=Lentibacillus sediminis TaxID=1940529 RepID=UPI000C1B8D9A|nr:DinB family protein [Lentibacillus sediminis]
MKSQSMQNHFITLERQREAIFPALQSLSMAQIWKRPQENKWSIGETMYHLYLITKMLRVAAVITIPCTKVFARMRRNKPFDSEINDIYKDYKEEHGKGMKAILDPPKKIHSTMDFNELNQILTKESSKVAKIVEDIDEDLAGHIIFLDPVAHNPNLIQAIQLLAIHEAHHIRIIENDLGFLINKTDAE